MIQAAILDIDGVLTDGKVTVSADGAESKTISFDDIDAVFELKRAGVKIGFITGEDDHFSEYVRKRFQPDFFISGCKDKLGAFTDLARKHSLDVKRTCFLGDSQKDIALLEYLDMSFTPSNVSPDVKAAAKTVLKARRGEGAIKEFVGHALYPKPADGFFAQGILEHVETIKLMLADGRLMQSVEDASEMLVGCFRQGGKLLICGNGGSAADSQHIATEFVSRFFLERPAVFAEALTANTSSLTAIGNDYTFDVVFSRQVEAMGKAGDVLMGISTSGNSKNVIGAMKKAKGLGLKTIALSGSNEKMAIADVSDHLIAVPSRKTPRIQEGHILIGHLICEYVEKKLFAT